MQVIRRLKISAVGSIVAAAIILVMLFLGVYRVNQAMKISEVADKIMSASFERVALRIDYQRTGSESAKAQYLAKHEQIGQFLKNASRMFEDAEDKETIKEMINDHESVGRIFAAIIAIREQKATVQSHADFSPEIENGLISQLNMKLYQVVSNVNKLHDSSREALFSALRLGGGGIVCLLAILIAAAVINSLTMGRTIADRIRSLRNGALVIGGGTLDHKIDVKGDDEFTELAETFNEMTTKLRRSHDALQSEINARKKAEEKAVRVKEEWERTFASVPDMIAILDNQHRVLRVNEAMAKQLGRKAEDCIGLHCYEAVHGLSAPPPFCPHLKTLSDGKAHIEEVHEDRLGGDFLVTTTPMLDEKGERVGSVHIAHDITEQKRAAELLRKNEARFRTLFETMTEGFSLNEIILDDMGNPVDLRYLSVNPGFERQTGLKARDIEGRTVRELFPEAESVWIERYGKVALIGEPVHFEERFGPLNKWFEVRAYQTEHGRFAVVFSDITERKMAEEEIKRLNDDLLVRNEKLAFANKELEAFSYSVSHDLRAPLRHMSGFAELLNKRLKGHTDEQIHHYMDAITKSSKKMGMLIDDLLAFSRIGRADVQYRKVSLNDLVRTSILELREEVKERDIVWEIDELPDVCGDQSMLRLVLDNLISNAVKYTQTRHQAKIQIGANPEGDEWLISIKDNGVGFNMEYVDKLFGVFQRLHAPDEFEGTGIGLANVRRIVSRHGGRTWAESVVGQGATFYFTLPKTKEA